MITDKTIKKLVPKNRRYTVRFGEGLFLRVLTSGKKSWVLRYYFAGKVRDFTLGSWPELKILQAKQLAHLKREELKVKPSKGLTFNDAYGLWKRKKKGHIVSFDDECQRIELHLMPFLKGIELDKITAPLVLNGILKLENKLPTLRRCLMRLNEILELSVCAGLLHQNPCRKLSKVFAQHVPTNRPFIPAEKLPLLFLELKNKNAPKWLHLYVLFAVYSLLRPNECASVKWTWIDKDVLVLPAETMKKKRIHRVPLCPGVLRVISMAKKLRKRRSVYVWCFGRGNSKVNKQYLSKWLNNSSLNGVLCHHGLRATGRTWMRDQRVPHEVAEDAIAHVSGTSYERAYLRGDYLEQRREIMEKWWQFIYEKYCAACAPLFDE